MSFIPHTVPLAPRALIIKPSDLPIVRPEPCHILRCEPCPSCGVRRASHNRYLLCCRVLWRTTPAADIALPSPGLRRLMGLFLSRFNSIIPRDDIMWEYYGIERDEPEWAARSFLVILYKFRRRLSPLGLALVTHYGRGLELVITGARA